jgi:phosphopantothenoylcysteine decarboxylase/phosphopantothenate--cysteine ligase
MGEATAPRLAGRRVLLGVGGGIAAYKSCDLASRLVHEGAQVTAVLTRKACKFVTPYTFEALTGRPCLTRQFVRLSGAAPVFPHLAPALDAEVFVLAPATANLIARLAAGLAGELLPALCLVARCPMLLCPGMNTRLWEHPATQRNLRVLRSFGYRILGPVAGPLACGEAGMGRMVEPREILEAVCAILAPKPDSAAAAPPASPPAPGHPGPGAKGRVRRSHKKN